IQVFAMV
ncbi:L-lactate dehydrogenase (cytochrome), partial [Haemophilus influenzae]